VLVPESGLVPAQDDDAQALTGEHWLDLQAAMDEPAPFIPTLRACAACLQAVRVPLRNLLHYHCGVRVFKTRQLMLDVQAMTRPRTPPDPGAGSSPDTLPIATAP